MDKIVPLWIPAILCHTGGTTAEVTSYLISLNRNISFHNVGLKVAEDFNINTDQLLNLAQQDIPEKYRTAIFNIVIDAIDTQNEYAIRMN